MQHIKNHIKEIVAAIILALIVGISSAVLYQQHREIKQLRAMVTQTQIESKQVVEKTELLRSGYQQFYSQFQDSALLQEDTVATLLGAIEVYDNNVDIYEERFANIEGAVIQNQSDIETLARIIKQLAGI